MHPLQKVLEGADPNRRDLTCSSLLLQEPHPVLKLCAIIPYPRGDSLQDETPIHSGCRSPGCTHVPMVYPCTCGRGHGTIAGRLLPSALTSTTSLHSNNFSSLVYTFFQVESFAPNTIQN